MPKVSVIVPNYNHARFLRQRIDTILAQTFQDFELILLDDASTDDSRTILSSYASDPRVRLEFNETNSGSTYKQWNKGVRLARGEYVWIAESDDYADAHLLERLIPLLDSRSSVIFAYCRSWSVSADGQLQGFADTYLDPLDPVHWKTDFCADGRDECRKYLVVLNPVPNASAVLFRKSAYEQVGGADGSFKLLGDRKLWASMALMGEIAYTAEPLNYFRFHDASVRNETQKHAVAAEEHLRLARWFLDRIEPTDEARKKLRRYLRANWAQAVGVWRLPLGRRISIIRDAIIVDPVGTLPRLIPDGLSALRRKFLKHWRQLTHAPAKGNPL